MGRRLIATLPAPDALAAELALMRRAAQKPEERYLWFWQSPQSLVAPETFGRKQGYSEAAATLATAGWPVCLRKTGGDVTPQGPGVVNVTHVYVSPANRSFDLNAEYANLCSPIEAALGSAASRGWQPGAFCDGAYNVQWNGLKFAGTAMRFRPLTAEPGRFVVLAHALMLFKPPSSAAIGAINVLLSLLDENRKIDVNAHTGLPDTTSPNTFLEKLRTYFTRLNDRPLRYVTDLPRLD